MKLFLLLICLVLQGFFDITLRKRPYYWVDRYLSLMKSLLAKLNLERGKMAVIGLLVPIVIVLSTLDKIIGNINLYYFFFAGLILLLCLDFRNFPKRLSDYFQAFDVENTLKAQVEAEKFIGRSIPQDKHEICRAVTEHIFMQSLSGLFAVIFWFMLLGPLGAVIYYFVHTLTLRSQKAEFEFADNAATFIMFKEVLDWLPIRVVTFTFALISHFKPVFEVWVDRVGAGLKGNQQFLIDVGLAALSQDYSLSAATVKENKQAIYLITRALWAWVLVIAVFKIISWL